MPETMNEAPRARGGGAPDAAPTMKSYEDWAREKLGLEVDERGRASAVRNGRRVAKISAAALANAARKLLNIPVGRRMTEADFDAAIGSAREIPITIT